MLLNFFLRLSYEETGMLASIVQSYFSYAYFTSQQGKQCSCFHDDFYVFQDGVSVVDGNLTISEFKEVHEGNYHCTYEYDLGTVAASFVRLKSAGNECIRCCVLAVWSHSLHFCDLFSNILSTFADVSCLLKSFQISQCSHLFLYIFIHIIYSDSFFC